MSVTRGSSCGDPLMVFPLQILAPSTMRDGPRYSTRPVPAQWRTAEREPCCEESARPSSALNCEASSGGITYARYRQPRPNSPNTPAPTSNHVVGMMKVSTNGRCTP